LVNDIGGTITEVSTNTTLKDNNSSIPTSGAVKYYVDNLYPIGSVYLNTNASVNPASTLKIGTWSLIITELKISTNVSYWERTA